MTDMVNVQRQRPVSDKLKVQNTSFCLDETYWGYIVRSTKGPGIGIVLAQSFSMFFGAALLAAALGLWVMPASVFGADGNTLRIGATVVFTGAAIMLLWFASRGTQTELQIDCNLGEVREVIRNRAGKTTLLGRYGFDSIGGVFLDRRAGEGMVSLVMRYRNTAQTMTVVSGFEADLLALRDRLGRDLMVPGQIAGAVRRSFGS